MNKLDRFAMSADDVVFHKPVKKSVVVLDPAKTIGLHECAESIGLHEYGRWKETTPSTGKRFKYQGAHRQVALPFEQAYVDNLISGKDELPTHIDGMSDEFVAYVCDKFRQSKINHKFDIPYLAGYSTDGKTVYVDKDLPDILDVSSWDEYEQALEPFEKIAAAKQKPVLPEDLDMTPYADEDGGGYALMLRNKIGKADVSEEERDDHGRWTAGSKDRPTVTGKQSKFRDRMQSAIDAIPADHAKLIAGVPIVYKDEGYLDKQSHDSVKGLFDYRNSPGRITVAGNYGARFGGRIVANARVIDPEATTTHEIGHALDFNSPSGHWGLSSSGWFKDAFNNDLRTTGITKAESEKAAYFLNDHKESWAEAYSLTYAPSAPTASANKSFGMARSRAEKVFAGTIAAIKAMKV